MSWVKLANDGDVHKTYARAVDARLLPPRVGHNWHDAAFRARHEVPQQLEGEWRGTRAFVVTPQATSNADDRVVDDDDKDTATASTFGRSAQQLLAAMTAASSSRRARGRSRADGDATHDNDDVSRGGGAAARAMTLDDKVLRFYAFFRERVPEGELYDYWYRYVVVSYYLADDTVHVYEPHVPNSGLDGGVFLRRQRVKMNARQRERRPGDAYLTASDFVVGESVRIHGIDFFVYDCDAATRALLGALGVHVADAVPCPVNARRTCSTLARRPAHATSNANNSNSSSSSGGAWRAHDSGKVLRFYGVLHERPCATTRDRVSSNNSNNNNNNNNNSNSSNDDVRHLELLLYIDDGSMAVVERAASVAAHGGSRAAAAATTKTTTAAAAAVTTATTTDVPAGGSGSGGSGRVFLSRCWLPKSGSLAPLSELTFAHRVNGQRAPDLGVADAFYTAADLDIGVTVNVLGRRVRLYDCDAFTRRYYAERYGVVLARAIDDGCTRHHLDGDDNNKQHTTTTTTRAREVCSATAPRDVLRFFLRLAHPRNAAERCRRFTLAYYTDTGEYTVYESAVCANNGYTPGCLVRRQRLRKPQPPVRFPLFALPPTSPPATPADAAATARSSDDYYTADDLRVGKQVVVCGLCMDIGSMDAHTAAYVSGHHATSASSATTTTAAAAAAARDAHVEHLLTELLEYLGSRYNTAVAAFLAFDHDRDGVVGVAEFAASLRRLQITDDAALARRLFARIASPAPPPPPSSSSSSSPADAAHDTAGVLTSNDLMAWMARTTRSDHRTRQRAGARDADAQADDKQHNNNDHGHDDDDDGGVSAAAQTSMLAARALRLRALTRLRERLEARCLTCTDMFRLASTMPRAYRNNNNGNDNSNDNNNSVHALCNVRRDAVVTPVQLRRCVREVLGGAMPDDELRCVLAFFYPALSPDEAASRRCDADDDARSDSAAAVDLPQFQRRFREMCALAQLPDGGNNNSSSVTAARVAAQV